MNDTDKQLIGMVAFVIIVFVTMGWLSSIPGETITTWDDIKIKSLSDTSLIHGSFSLGSGSVAQTPVYIYYEILPDGYYKMGWFNARYATVKEDCDDAPYIRIYHDEWTWMGVMGSTGQNRAEFHVPNGTVINTYNLDLKV